MVLSSKKYVRMEMSKQPFYVAGASSCGFRFNLHPDSKFRRWWLSEESRFWHQEENRLMSTGSIRLDASQMMDGQVSYSMLWDFLTSVPISARAKHSVIRCLVSYAHSILELSCGGFHKLWNITLRLDICQNCILEKEDTKYNNWGAAEQEQEQEEQEEEEECCSICLDEMVIKGSTVTRLTCSHMFHGDCISKWLRNGSSTCPLCRSQVPLIITA